MAVLVFLSCIHSLIFLFSSPVTIVIPTEVVGGNPKKLAPDRDGRGGNEGLEHRKTHILSCAPLPVLSYTFL